MRGVASPDGSTDHDAARTALLAERARLAAEVGEAIVRARADDLRLAGRGRQPGLRAAARPRPARPSTAQLALVEDALARLDDGSFGACVRCGKPIAAARLEALPWAATCIDCQRDLDRGAR